NDDYWYHEFIIKPVMKVNDKIVMKSKIYLADDKFGSAKDGHDLEVDDGGNVKVHHLYMEYMSPIGKLRVGRTSAGLWQGSFLSTDSYANRIMYFPNFLPKPLGACIFTQKSAEKDSLDPNNVVDQDSDLYEASVWYKTKDLRVALGYDFWDFNQVTTADSTRQRIKGYYNQNMGNVYTEMEFSYDWGTVDSDTAGVDDVDTDTFAIMADVGMTMDKLDVGLMFFYASGDGDSTDNDNESAMFHVYGGLGEQFQPYQVLTGRHTGMLSNDVNGINADMAFHGIMSLGVHADFAVTDKLSLHTAIAYALADTDEWTFDPLFPTLEIDDEYGWEIDLGVSYALLDNLTYSVDFGYLMTGDFFEGYQFAGVGPFGDTEDVYVLNHKLAMEF
ncbi:MAG: porin, partial [Thermodesulfobacteriota bacterium]